MEEQKLARRLKQGDRFALSRAMDTYTPYLSSVVWHTMGPAATAQDVEEVVSDAFLSLWRRRETLEPEKGVKSWLAAVARNRAIDRLRASPLPSLPLEAAEETPGAGLDQELERRILAERLRSAVEALEPPDDSLVVRFYYEGDKLKDTASAQEYVNHTVYSVSDENYTFTVETGAALEPFFLRRMEPLTEGSGYPVPVRELTERLGGVCRWDPDTGDVSCTYRGVRVVLHPGVDTATVDGQPVSMWGAPAVQEGSLAASWGVFRDAWGLDGFVTYTRGEPVPNPDDPTVLDIPTDYHDWYVIP